MDSCKFVGLRLGSDDILVHVLGQSRAEISDIVDRQIANFQGVTSIDVREPIGSKKQRFDLTHVV